MKEQRTNESKNGKQSGRQHTSGDTYCIRRSWHEQIVHFQQSNATLNEID